MPSRGTIGASFGLSAKFDAIIIPDQNARIIARGPAGNYPDSLKGGIGDAEEGLVPEAGHVRVHDLGVDTEVVHHRQPGRDL